MHTSLGNIQDKGFAEPLRLNEELPNSYMQMSPGEMERAMQEAVQLRDAADPDAFVTMLDESGRPCRKYDDGRVEYVLY